MKRTINDLPAAQAAETGPPASGTLPGPAETLPTPGWLSLFAWAMPGPAESPELLLVTMRALKIPR